MDCPQWLAPEAREIWDRLTGQLERINLVNEVDETGLAALCQQIARWRQAEAAIDEHGLILIDDKGRQKLNPAARFADGALKHIKALLIQFGFTPRARGQITGETPDELDAFLRPKG